MSERIYNPLRRREQRVIRIPDDLREAYLLISINTLVFSPFLAERVRSTIPGRISVIRAGQRAFLQVLVQNRALYIEEDLQGDLGFRADTSDRYDAELKEVMDVLAEEVFALLQILNILSPVQLFDLQAGTRSDILRALFSPAVNLGRAFSFKEVGEEESDEIQELISSPNQSLREIGKERIKKVRAKMGLQIMYQNQYGDIIKQLRRYLEMDVYAGPGGFRCSIA